MPLTGCLFVLTVLAVALVGCVQPDGAPQAALAADPATQSTDANGIVDVTVGVSENVPLANTLDLPAGRQVNFTLVVGDAPDLPADQKAAYQGVRVRCPSIPLDTGIIAGNTFATFTFTMPAQPVACNIQRASTGQPYDTLTLRPA